MIDDKTMEEIRDAIIEELGEFFSLRYNGIWQKKEESFDRYGKKENGFICEILINYRDEKTAIINGHNYLNIRITQDIGD